MWYTAFFTWHSIGMELLANQGTRNGDWCKLQMFRAFRSPRDYVDIRVLRSGSKARDKGDSGNHCLSDPYVSVVFWTPIKTM